MTPILKLFAHNLRIKLRNYGITQAKLAEQVNVSTHHIAMIEIAREYPTLELVERIARALEIEFFELFLDPNSPSNSPSLS